MQETLHWRTVCSSSHVLGQRKQMVSEQPASKSAGALAILNWLDLPEKRGESVAVRSKDSGDKKHHGMWNTLKQVHADCSVRTTVIMVTSMRRGQNGSGHLQTLCAC